MHLAGHSKGQIEWTQIQREVLFYSNYSTAEKQASITAWLQRLVEGLKIVSQADRSTHMAQALTACTSQLCDRSPSAARLFKFGSTFAVAGH